MDNDIDLPSYTAVSGPELGSSATDQISPSPANFPETRPHERSEHSHVLTDSKGKPWATLILQSSARSPQHMPIFMEEDTVEGSLSLDLDKKGSITSVLIIVSQRLPVRALGLTSFSR